MADIRPFRGIRYNVARTGGLQEVIGPPEDILSAARAAELVAGRPFNAVRLEMANPSRSMEFGHAAELMRRWFAEGIVFQDPTPAFYLYEHEFPYDGVWRRRRGFFAALRLPNDGDRADILPHERTMPQNVAIRTALRRALQTDLSAVYTLVEDGGVEAILDEVAAREPSESGVDPSGGMHRIWLVTDPARIEALQEAVAQRALYIADGHHRYEAALIHRSELLNAGGPLDGANYVLTYIVDVADPGMLVLPIHRVVRSFGQQDWTGIRSALAHFFDVQENTLSDTDAVQSLNGQIEQLATSRGMPTYLALEPGATRVLTLRLREWDAVEPFLPEDVGATARHLDVSVLDAILRQMLGYNPQEIGHWLDFTPHTLAAHQNVRTGEAATAFFVRPTPLSSLIAVAKAGDRMPQKSTYFYPKVPIGLVLYDLTNEDMDGVR